jgi:RNA polymerase sigma-70 factor (ECF subfamily)
MDESDDELMRRSGRGDRQAFTRLVGRYLDRGVALAARIVGERSEAEEIVQEALLRAWLKAPAWQPRDGAGGGAQFSTWLFRVTVNLCLDRKRRRRPEPLTAAPEIADPAPAAPELIERAELGRRVAAAVAALPERQRAALALCHYDGLSNSEAAEVLGLSIGAVEALLVRARRGLRASLMDLAPATAEAAGRGRQ